MEDDGFGKMVTRQEMKNDEQRGFKPKECMTVFFKPSMFELNSNIFKQLNDKDLNENYYLHQFRKATDPSMIKIVRRYHPQLSDLTETQIGSSQGIVKLIKLNI